MENDELPINASRIDSRPDEVQLIKDYLEAERIPVEGEDRGSRK